MYGRGASWLKEQDGCVQEVVPAVAERPPVQGAVGRTPARRGWWTTWAWRALAAPPSPVCKPVYVINRTVCMGQASVKLQRRSVLYQNTGYHNFGEQSHGVGLSTCYLSLSPCLGAHSGCKTPPTVFPPGNSYLKIWLRSCLLHRVFLKEIHADLRCSTFCIELQMSASPTRRWAPWRQGPWT